MLRRLSTPRFRTSKHDDTVTICLGGYTSRMGSSACWKLSSLCLLNCHNIPERGSSPCGMEEKTSPPLSGICTEKGESLLVGRKPRAESQMGALTLTHLRL